MLSLVGFKVVGYYFQSQLEPSVKRNSQRSENERIPDAGIRQTYSKLELPCLEEGFEELFYVSIRNGEFDVKEWNAES